MIFSKLPLSGMIPGFDTRRWPIYYFLPVLAGLYSFLVVIAIFLPGGINEQEESLSFVLGWFAAFGSAALSAGILARSLQTNLQESDHHLWVLLAFNSAAFVILTTGLYLSGQGSGSAAPALAWQPVEPAAGIFFWIYSGVLIIPVGNALLIWWMRDRPQNFPITGLVLLSLSGLLGLVWFLDPLHSQISPKLVLMAILGGALFTFLNNLSVAIPGNRAFRPAADILVILVIILACFDPLFSINISHENFYLGPVNRILHGGTALVDAFSQYGVLVLYFLGVVFKTGIIPLTYQGMSLLMALLLMLHFIMIYFVLTALFRARLFAILMLGIIILLGLFGTLGILQAYPSTGPLRFGLPYLMLITVYLRKRFPALRRVGSFAEYGLVGIASLWSFETFVYTAFPYLGICLYESFSRPEDLHLAVRRFLQRLTWFLLALAAFQIVLLLFTYFRAGELPDWKAYLGFIGAYSSQDGFGTLLIYPWIPWFLMIGIYFASLAIFLIRFILSHSLDDSPQSVFIFGLTLTGIAMFTYFLGRSHTNNLFHISTPAVIIAGFGYTRLENVGSFSKLIRSAATAIFYTAAIFTFLVVSPIFWQKVQENHTGYSMAATGLQSILEGQEPHLSGSEWESLTLGSGSQQVSEAVRLLDKYIPDQSRATVFLTTVNTTEVLMTSDRIHTFPINDVVEDLISERVFLGIMESPQVLRVNDYIFLLGDPLSYRSDDVRGNNFEKLQIHMIDRLCQDFHFKEVETSPTGVMVIRLRPRNAASSPYCETIRELKERLPD